MTQFNSILMFKFFEKYFVSKTIVYLLKYKQYYYLIILFRIRIKYSNLKIKIK